MIRAVIFDMFETLITHYQSPLYFGEQMAADAGISNSKFQELWRPAGKDRTIGKISLEELLETILRANGRYSEARFHFIVQKRMRAKEELFAHLHREILPLLQALQDRGLLIGLISNCFSEEVAAIKKSPLYPYFDAACLSYEEGIQKPDPEIFQRCLGKLGVQAYECLYVGDGGSLELEAASEMGMRAVQAVWYFQKGSTREANIKPKFEQIETPLDVLDYV